MRPVRVSRRCLDGRQLVEHGEGLAELAGVVQLMDRLGKLRLLLAQEPIVHRWHAARGALVRRGIDIGERRGVAAYPAWHADDGPEQAGPAEGAPLLRGLPGRRALLGSAAT